MLNFIINEFSVIVLVIGFLILLSNNLKVQDSKSKKIKTLLLEVTCITIFNVFEYYFSTLNSFNYGRLFFSFLCYSLRPVIVITFISLITDSKKIKYFYFLSLINMIIYSTCFYSNIVFSFNDNNSFTRGPLGYTSHILCFIYAILFIFLIIKKYNKQSINKIIMLSFILIISSIAAIFDIKFSSTLFDQTILMCSLFYYLFLYMEYNKIDKLTNIFNRSTFYNDIEKYKNIITSIISIDMNGLKQINDTLGHSEGDKALITISEILLKSEKNKTRYYRIGGDEFVAFCFNANEKEVKQLIKKINSNLSETKYSCSIGYEMCDSNDNKYDVYKKADKKMYKEKEKYHTKLKTTSV